MFIYNSSIGGSLIHYNILSEKPLTKFIQLNKQSGEYKYIDDVGNESSFYLHSNSGIRKCNIGFSNKLINQ